jgi:hypothetical protein
MGVVLVARSKSERANHLHLRLALAMAGRGVDRVGAIAVCSTLVGGTYGQLREKSRFQKASHWPFSLR